MRARVALNKRTRLRNRVFVVLGVLAVICFGGFACFIVWSNFADVESEFSPDGQYVAYRMYAHEAINSWKCVEVRRPGLWPFVNSAEVRVEGFRILSAEWRGNNDLEIGYDSEARFVRQPRKWGNVRISYSLH